MKGSSRGVLVAIERPKGPVGVNGAGIAEEPPPPVAPAEPREKAVKDGCKNSEGQYLTSLVCRSGPSDSRCQHRIHRSQHRCQPLDQQVSPRRVPVGREGVSSSTAPISRGYVVHAIIPGGNRKAEALA